MIMTCVRFITAGAIGRLLPTGLAACSAPTGTGWLGPAAVSVVSLSW